MIERICKHCKFWQMISETPVLGTCRRNAPQSIARSPLAESENLDAVWPRTKPDDWCGQWERKVDIEAES